MSISMKLVIENNDSITSELQQRQRQLEDSLEYASYIQHALLPEQEDILKVFPDSFVFYHPKDIVGGDFYWIYDDGNRIMLALGDSTGHGVPGAFLSILGLSLLNQVVSKHNPSLASCVLNYLREYLMKALGQTGREEEQKDGFDMALCVIDKENNYLQYAGAYIPLYIVRDGELIQLEGDKMPIGVAAEMEEPFVNKEFELKKNDFIYLFSDGFPDQFGGSEGKKYKYRNFRNLLIRCSNLPAVKQSELLLDELEAWKGKYPQVDDITIVGLRYC